MNESAKGRGPDDNTATQSRGSADARPPFRYDARLADEIERRWQDRWEKAGTFHTPNPAGPLAEGFDRVLGRPKFFAMDMFPYPSGAGLHVGHPLGYIATDVYARYLRMTGYNVLHPFGYDAFGPARPSSTPSTPGSTRRSRQGTTLRICGANCAALVLATTGAGSSRPLTRPITAGRSGSSCRSSTAGSTTTGRARPVGELVAEFESGQREPVSPANPGSRTWTGLTELQRREVIDSYRLAYISQQLVNWCPGLGTVLANEEITADGRSDIGNYPVYRRPLRQWMLRITAYAQRLLDDLDLLDWPESIKLMQRNWIGPSDGANVDFPVEGAPELKIRIFTTRPDTLPGATYMVLAPGHPMVDSLVTDAWPEPTPREWRYPQASENRMGAWTPAAAVRAYRQMASKLGDRERVPGSYEKTGVFTGSYVLNPMTGEPIPIFVADYVLMGYGTGAIMAVPAHDERDFEFARQFRLPVRAVLNPPAAWSGRREIPACTPAGEWPEAFTGEGSYLCHPIPGLDLAGLDMNAGIDAAIRWLKRRGRGQHARAYRLRDWLFSRQRYWGEPFPVVYDEDGLPLPLPEEMLPVRLPEMTDFRPQPQPDEYGDPVPPLARVTEWVEAELDLGDGRKHYHREANTMPQWAGSCWYYLRYLDPANDERLVDPDVERYWMVPSQEPRAATAAWISTSGAPSTRCFICSTPGSGTRSSTTSATSRPRSPSSACSTRATSWPTRSPTPAACTSPPRRSGRRTAGEFRYRDERVDRRAGKMGKSLKNSVSPDDIYAAYGADTLRLYEMAMGPLDADRPWRTDDMVGVHRFLQRLWRNIIDERTGEHLVDDRPLDEETAPLPAPDDHDRAQGLRGIAFQHRDRTPDRAQHPRKQGGATRTCDAPRASRTAPADGRPARAAHCRRTVVADRAPGLAGLRAVPAVPTRRWQRSAPSSYPCRSTARRGSG